MNSGKPFPWLRFIALGGPDGLRWAEGYETYKPIHQTAQEAVKRFRRGEQEEGWLLLQSAWGRLCAIDEAVEPSFRHVVERWYYGALGFYHYSCDAFDEAGLAMTRAHEAVVTAVQRRRCLICLAMDCYEFEMHRSRIAREQQHWREMRERAEAAAAMRAGSQPLCMLGDGTPVWLADVQKFYRSLSGLSSEDQSFLARIADDGLSRVEAERSMRNVLRLPGFVIEYP